MLIHLTEHVRRRMLQRGVTEQEFHDACYDGFCVYEGWALEKRFHRQSRVLVVIRTDTGRPEAVTVYRVTKRDMRKLMPVAERVEL